jgi:hypothetical protein
MILVPIGQPNQIAKAPISDGPRAQHGPVPGLVKKGLYGGHAMRELTTDQPRHRERIVISARI